MKHVGLAAVLIFLLYSAAACHQPDQTLASGGREPPGTLVQGMASLHHPVSTRSADAQKFFDQGLTYVYAFNHPEAVRSFERAAQLDPRMAMAYWGIALSLGPNIVLVGASPHLAEPHA